MTPDLEPVLERNRGPYEKLERMKMRLAVGFFIVGMVVISVVPHEHGGLAVIILFAALAAAFGGVEVQKYRIFLRDLRDRDRPES